MAPGAHAVRLIHSQQARRCRTEQVADVVAGELFGREEDETGRAGAEQAVGLGAAAFRHRGVHGEGGQAMRTQVLGLVLLQGQQR